MVSDLLNATPAHIHTDPPSPSLPPPGSSASPCIHTKQQDYNYDMEKYTEIQIHINTHLCSHCIPIPIHHIPYAIHTKPALTGRSTAAEKLNPQ
ncbi:hypothetical protein EON63_24940 [archaeon]|nr:MAG: hypothetical protein EON63_24940 [archaeon]